jgi:hypothetical protein
MTGAAAHNVRDAEPELLETVAIAHALVFTQPVMM